MSLGAAILRNHSKLALVGFLGGAGYGFVTVMNTGVAPWGLYGTSGELGPAPTVPRASAGFRP